MWVVVNRCPYLRLISTNAVILHATSIKPPRSTHHTAHARGNNFPSTTSHHVTEKTYHSSLPTYPPPDTIIP
ncbi:hypothetical protein P153DRAFT_368503 [Dothidotthia symphoricarpi CBS 119687]|uniref:Uncharacterized protein n=1 Tax=Dothidotthia symphoricarpi CBS 119687 TaxID=1392245 RepID=A0A6A6A7N9_9PLEO|nr:uncharacterized protein P153DRAFT_368503 [Dothidotthia symphoricarpi CBS 119687]KAF2127173.1 hypothetical protein P153DRAFT_368503 [Dothidotthia symphoricarpi CBS 119687]